MLYHVKTHTWYIHTWLVLKKKKKLFVDFFFLIFSFALIKSDFVSAYIMYT